MKTGGSLFFALREGRYAGVTYIYFPYENTACCLLSGSVLNVPCWFLTALVALDFILLSSGGHHLVAVRWFHKQQEEDRVA